MSGHNKWSTIKHRKGAQDAKRSKIFTRLTKLITIAAQEGGGNPESNIKLKFAIDQARKENVPKDNIERAVKRGTGELNDGTRLEEVVYEGMGPEGIAMIITATTDNTNRTVSEVKSIFTKNGGKFVPGGSVSFQFKHVGIITTTTDGKDIEELELAAIEAGAQDVREKDSLLIIETDLGDLHSVQQSLESAGHEIEESSLAYIATQTVSVSEEAKKTFEKLAEAIESQDDVDEIFTNLEQ